MSADHVATSRPAAEVHSPGPWRILWNHVGQGTHPTLPELHYVCIHSQPADSVERELHISGYVRKPDAYLLAAAPELLKLAEQYAVECAECLGTGRAKMLDTNGYPAGDVDCEACSAIRAVIAKARGDL